VVDYYGLDASALLRRHDPHVARAVAAWLCRRHSEATLRELAVRLGLSRASSVPNLTRRLEARLAKSSRLARELAAIMREATMQANASGEAGWQPSHPDERKCPSGQTVVRTRAGAKKKKNKNKV
jgi:hypothetical protein